MTFPGVPHLIRTRARAWTWGSVVLSILQMDYKTHESESLLSPTQSIRGPPHGAFCACTHLSCIPADGVTLSSCTAPPGRPSGVSHRVFWSVFPLTDDALVAGRAETQA